VGKIVKKQSEGARFWLIRHSKYSAIVKNTLPQIAFGDFAYWVLTS